MDFGWCTRVARGRARLFAVAAAIACFVLPASAGAAPNVVVIVTDDQAADTLAHMPATQELLVDRGVTFANAFASNPFCCPARAALLTGNYSHTTGVYDNVWPNGGYQRFDDRSTLATWLRGAGYRTGLFGKYMNDYDAAYVPPGWSDWFGLWRGGYYGAQVSVNGQVQVLDDSTYANTWFTDQARGFITSTPPGQPVFLYFATRGPHQPTIPERKYDGAFDGIEAFRPAAFNEADVSDKPAYVRSRAPLDAATIGQVDRLRRDHLETLLSVDDSVAAIAETLRDTGRLGDTVFVFTSDNGWGYGQHRLAGKRHPYDESLRVPLVIRYDPLTAAAPRTVTSLTGNVDLAPTIAQLAGVAAPRADGVSLVPTLASSAPVRDSLLIEHSDPAQREPVPTYCGVRGVQFHYVQYATREEELYDVVADPAQLQNLAGNPGAAGTLQSMRESARRLCSPQPPGWVGEPVIAGGLLQPVSFAWPTPVSWRTDHPERGVTGYDVDTRTTSPTGSVGGWKRWLTSAPATARMPVRPGTTVCVRVSARDSLANASRRTTPACVHRPYDAASFGKAKGWSLVRRRGGPYAPALTASKQGATLVLPRVRARELRLVATTCPKCGTVVVRHAGRRVATISLRSRTRRTARTLRTIKLPALRTGPLTLRISSKAKPVAIHGLAAISAPAYQPPLPPGPAPLSPTLPVEPD